jgi:HrpA-like RNA helicase
MAAARAKLPAAKAKEQFLSLLRENRVVLVVGETG